MEYVLKSVCVEDRRKPFIYCVRFYNDPLPSKFQMFASCGANSAMIYKVDQEDDVMHTVHCYVDEDYEESFFSCDWGVNRDGVPLLCIAGEKGTIKIINCVDLRVEQILQGHGNSVNELRIHPVDDGLLFSASKDKSIRLWNIHSGVCIAIFAGDEGHTNEVLSIDIHALGNCFASTSMDTSIKIWNLQSPDLQRAIKMSYGQSVLNGKDNFSFKTNINQAPLFSTTLIHSDYVDSVKWVGDCLITKSTKLRVVLWSPDALRYKGAPLILQEYSLPNSTMWFIKLDVCIPLNIFAVGNTRGKVYIFPLTKDKSNQTQSDSLESEKEYDEDTVNPRDANGLLLNQERFQTNHPTNPLCGLGYHKTQSTVRQVTFSNNGRYLVSGFDDGSIHLWACKIHPSSLED